MTALIVASLYVLGALVGIAGAARVAMAWLPEFAIAIGATVPADPVTVFFQALLICVACWTFGAILDELLSIRRILQAR